MIYKLYPECKDYVWGGRKLCEKYGKNAAGDVCAESWELSYHSDGPVRIEGGALLKDVLLPSDLGARAAAFPFFPVLIKFIDAKENLSVQVHPTDEYALKYENSFGKTEMWYVAEADSGAGIYCGFKESVDKDVFESKVKDGTVEELLNFIEVKKGDCYFIESGTLHAICKGCVILEVQQNSNLTYRVYDYNRLDKDGKPRALHLDKAMEVTNFQRFTPVNFDSFASSAIPSAIFPSVSASESASSVRLLAKCKYFDVREVKVRGEYRDMGEDTFVSFSCVEGSGTVDGTPFALGDSFFIPANRHFTVSGTATVIVTRV